MDQYYDEYRFFERENPGLIDKALAGDVEACSTLVSYYLGIEGKGECIDFVKAEQWIEKMYHSEDMTAKLFYAGNFTIFAYRIRDTGAVDVLFDIREVLSKLRKSNDFLMRYYLDYNNPQTRRIILSNELEIGWYYVCLGEKEQALMHFKRACSIRECSDIWWGIAVCHMGKEDLNTKNEILNHFRELLQYGKAAIGKDDWIHSGDKLRCYKSVGKFLREKALFGTDIYNLELSYEYIAIAAKLGDDECKKDLSRYSRNVFGKLKFH